MTDVGLSPRLAYDCVMHMALKLCAIKQSLIQVSVA